MSATPFGRPAHAGVVEQDVQAAEGVLRQVHGGGDLAFVGDVTGGEADLVGETLFQHLALLGLQVGGDDPRPLGHEQFHRSQPDARASPGDHRDLAVQTSRHAPLPLGRARPLEGGPLRQARLSWRGEARLARTK
jgi:hypothetical protein